MSFHELTIYEWTCDGCGDTEQVDVEDMPHGWSNAGDDEHWCEGCS